MTSVRKIVIGIVFFFCLAPHTYAATIDRPMNNLGMLGYWPLDGATTNWSSGTTQDVSGNSVTGTLKSMSTTTQPVIGKVGQALKFSKPGQYVDLGTGLNPSAITYAAWVKADTWSNSNGYNGIVVRNNGAGQFSAMMVKSTGKLAFFQGNGSSVSYDGTGANTLSTGTWYFLVFTYDSVNGLVGYVNGSVDGTASANGALTSTAITTAIGTDPSLASTRNFNGTIDDVRIYGRALSAAEVKALYAAEVTHLGTGSNSLRTNQLAYWKFDEGSGSTASDATGNGNTGTLSGSTPPTWTTSGKINNALTFNGSTAYVTLTSSSINAATSAFTVGFWVNFSSLLNGYYPLIDIYDETNNKREWTIGTGTTGHQFNFITSTTGAYIANRDMTSVTTPTTGTWYYVVCTYDSTVGAKIYVNGSLDNSNAQTGTLFAATGVPLVMMSAANTYGGSTRFSAGTLDEVGFWSRALSASEVASLYNKSVGLHYPYSQTTVGHSNAASGGSGLVGYWTMDGSLTNWATGQETDASGNGNTGSLVNMSTTTSPIIGKIGQALKFNGTSQDIQVPNSSAISLSSVGTFSAWVYPMSNSGYQGIIAKRGACSATVNYEFYTNNGDLRFYLGGVEFSSGYTLALNQWQLVTGVQKSNNTMDFYVNGSFITNVATAAMGANSNSLTIGTASCAGTYWNGSIDDVRIYNRALSASEVQALYNSR